MNFIKKSLAESAFSEQGIKRNSYQFFINKCIKHYPTNSVIKWFNLGTLSTEFVFVGELV
jgi:hypothetical protein